MEHKELLEKYGRITKRYDDDTYVGMVKGYEVSIQPNGDYYILDINVNSGIRKWVETISEIEEILKGL